MTESGKSPLIGNLQALERLIAGLVHDLNNPLAGIIGYAQLARGERDPERQTRFLDSIVLQAESIRDALGDLSALSSTTRPPAVRLSPGEIIGLARLRYEGAMNAAGVTLQVSIPKGLPPVTGDLDALARAIGKLLDNALRAVRPMSNPFVQIVVREDSGFIAIDVLDNGEGFPPDVLERAFDPTATTRRSGNGVGLGLPLALAVAERHGGTVRIVPSGGGLRPGAGTRVQMRVPVAGPV